MHEIYLLAVLFNASRPPAELGRDQRLRNEQAFYDRHGGDRRWRFPGFAGLAPVLSVAVVAFGVVFGVARRLLH